MVGIEYVVIVEIIIGDQVGEVLQGYVVFDQVVYVYVESMEVGMFEGVGYFDLVVDVLFVQYCYVWVCIGVDEWCGYVFVEVEVEFWFQVWCVECMCDFVFSIGVGWVVVVFLYCVGD